MGLFLPSTQDQELDPRWQRRRRLLLTLIGVSGAAVSAAVVWHFSLDRESAPRPVGTSAEGSDPLPRRAQESGLETATPGRPLRDDRPRWTSLAGASLAQADPWVIDWLRVWDRHDGADATLEDAVRAVEAALMTGNTLLARDWYRRAQWRLADPQNDPEAIDPILRQRLEVLHLVMSGRVESALALLQQTADERPLASEERLMQALVRRELVGGELWAGWVEDLIALAGEDHRGGAQARLLLLQWLEGGAARELPQRALRATGDPRLMAAVAGDQDTGVDPPLGESEQELAAWLRGTWREIAAAQPRPAPAVQMALFSLDWLRSDHPVEIPRVIDEVQQWAEELDPEEWQHVADWLARRGEWDAVRHVLRPGRGLPLNPRTFELYATAMIQLGHNEELGKEMREARSRWPEPLVLLWAVHTARESGPTGSPALMEGMLMGAGRSAQALEPRWMFDVARTAFAFGYPDAGANLLLLATAAPEIRERALAMLLDRSLEAGHGEEALYVAEQLRRLKPFPGPWHGAWLWLKLMVEREPDQVLEECRQWLERLPEDRQTEARFIGAMAAAELNDHETARRWLPRVNANELPPRYLLFHIALVEDLAMDDLLTIAMEQRRGGEPVYMTRQEAAWLGQHQAMETSLLRSLLPDLPHPSPP